MNPDKLLKEIIREEIVRNKIGNRNERVELYRTEQETRKIAREALHSKALTSVKVDKILNGILKEDIDKIPYNSTAMNVLKDLLKKIIPILESSYKMLTSDRAQRKSFEAHLIVGIKNSIGMAKLYKDSDEKLADQIRGGDIKQYIGGTVSPEVEDALTAYDEAVPQAAPEVEMPEKPVETIKELADLMMNNFKDIYKKALLERKVLQREAGGIDFNKFTPEKPEVVQEEAPVEENPAFLNVGEEAPKQVAAEEPDKMAGLDPNKYNETGRNIAIDAFGKIEKSIVAAYNLLADGEDRKIFYIYLIANIVMHFRRFEDELNSALQSSDVIPQESEQKIDKATEQPTDQIQKVIGGQPSKNISKPAPIGAPAGINPKI